MNENKSAVEETEVKPIDKVAQESGKEKALFNACMVDIVPEGKRTKEVLKAIEGLYTSYRAVVDSTHNLAKKVYQFQLLTGLSYEDIGSAMSKGLQKEFSRSYIFRLHRAGSALINHPITRGISDIVKLSELGQFDKDTLEKLVTVDPAGLIKIGPDYAQLIPRDKFKSKLAALTGTEQVKPKPKAAWDLGAFKVTLEKAMEANVNEPAYLHAITEVYNMTMAKIKAATESQDQKSA